MIRNTYPLWTILHRLFPYKRWLREPYLWIAAKAYGEGERKAGRT